VHTGFLRILEFARKTKLRKDRDLEKFRGKMRFEVTSWNQAQETIFIENLNRWWISEGEGGMRSNRV
jgi:hypothetical protein